MMSFLTPLASAWHSYRKQHLLWWVTLFLLFPSLTIGDLIQKFFLQREFLPLTLLILLGTIGLHVWGQACVLRFGQSRRSLRALLLDTRSLILPLLLTSILRQCLTLLWGILLILPGLLYSIRTTLFDAVLAIEGQQYRPALQRSAFIVRNNMWRTLGIIIATYFFFLPAYLLDLLPFVLPSSLTEVILWDISILVLKNMILAGGIALSLLTHIALYKELLTTGLAARSPLPLEQYDETPADG